MIVVAHIIVLNRMIVALCSSSIMNEDKHIICVMKMILISKCNAR